VSRRHRCPRSAQLDRHIAPAVWLCVVRNERDVPGAAVRDENRFGPGSKLTAAIDEPVHVDEISQHEMRLSVIVGAKQGREKQLHIGEGRKRPTR